MLFSFINEMFNFCLNNVIGKPIINKGLFYIFGKFIHQFPPETKALIRTLERILNLKNLKENYIEQLYLYYLIKHT